jgi:NAD(P)-dependent dehydrogenase (short-subunit alcohol dehydrogenase family)
MKDSAIRHIVNIGTLGAMQGRKKFAGLAAYSSSKAALANLTELLHEELKEDHICINYLALGAVNTDMFTEAFPEGNTDTSPKEMASYIARFALNEWKNTSGKLVEVVL